MTKWHCKKLQKCFRAQGHEEMCPIFERINTMLEHFTIKLLPKLREVQAKGDIWWNNGGGGWKGKKHGGDFTTNDSMHIGTNNQDNSFHNELESQKLTCQKRLATKY
jgi:hypothetical protein